MTPFYFTALSSFPNLNDGVKTFAVTVQAEDPPVEPRHVETIGGVFFDTRGDQKSKQKPSKRTVKFLLKASTPALLHADINRLRFVDKGKKGTLTYDGGSGLYYLCTAVLEQVNARFLYDTPQQAKAEISLVVQELTTLQVII